MAKRKSHGSSRVRHLGPRRAWARSRGDESGFTLIEVLFVIVILPLIIGGIAAALISVISLNQRVQSRIGNSNDALVSASTFNKDVQSAQEIETTTTPGCGSGNQVVGLQWGLDANGNYQTVVSYVTTTTGNKTSLTRQLCTGGASPTATSSFTVGHDVGTPNVTFNPCGFLASGASWSSTKGLYGVMLNINKTSACPNPAPLGGGSYSYSLSGLPGNGSSTGSFTQVFQTPNPAGCNLASPGTGTYANVLCFADFSTFTDPSSGCQQFKLPIENSEDFLQFCVIASPTNTVRPQSIPTYPDASSPQFGYDSEAYLGNNGFYTGIAGKGALSQRPQSSIGFNPPNSTYTAITFTNIQVVNLVGDPQTGWTLITGDAESTDTNGWLEFQNSTVPWSILPNSSNSLWGNSCYDSSDSGITGNPYSGAMQWNGSVPPPPGALAKTSKSILSIGSAPNYNTGANGILCESDTQLNKTGTLMVAAPEPANSSAPQTVTDTLQGEGYQAIFLGVLL